MKKAQKSGSGKKQLRTTRATCCGRKTGLGLCFVLFASFSGKWPV